MHLTGDKAIYFIENFQIHVNIVGLKLMVSGHLFGLIFLLLQLNVLSLEDANVEKTVYLAFAYSPISIALFITLALLDVVTVEVLILFITISVEKMIFPLSFHFSLYIIKVKNSS